MYVQLSFQPNYHSGSFCLWGQAGWVREYSTKFCRSEEWFIAREDIKPSYCNPCFPNTFNGMMTQGESMFGLRLLYGSSCAMSVKQTIGDYKVSSAYIISVSSARESSYNLTLESPVPPPSLPVTPHTSKSTHTPLSISFPIIFCSSPSLPILPPYPLRCSMGCRITHSRKNNYLIFGKWNFLRTNLTDRTMLTLEDIGKLFRIVRENIWFSAGPSYVTPLGLLQQFDAKHSLPE